MSAFWRACGVISAALLITVSGLSGSGLCLAQSDSIRKWKDATGQFEIEASFVSEANGVVTLKQKDGGEVEINMKDLSISDQGYVRVEKAKASSPFKTRESKSPFQPRTNDKSMDKPADRPDRASRRSSADKNKGPEPTSAPEPETQVVDWSGAPQLLGTGSGEWSSIKMTVPEAGKKLRAVALGGKSSVFEKEAGTWFGDGFAITGFYTLPFGNHQAATRLVRSDLDTGRLVGGILIEGAFQLAGTSRNGETLLMLERREHQHEAPLFMELWKPAGKVVERLKRFEPFPVNPDDRSPNRKGISSAALLDSGLILVASEEGRLGVIDPETGVAKLELPGVKGFQLAPDENYMASWNDKTLQIVDLKAADIIGTIPLENAHQVNCSFSPDGSRLALFIMGQLQVWNMATGEMVQSETVNFPNPYSRVTMLTQNLVMIGNSLLYDLDQHLPVWSYSGIESLQLVNQTIVAMTNDNALLPLTLPHPAAEQALKSAASNPNLFAVRPGTSFRIDVSGIPDSTEQAKAREGLEKQLAKVGMKVEPNGEIELKVSMSSAPEEMNFRTMGIGQSTRVTVQKYTFLIQMIKQGNEIWKSSMSNSVGMMVRSSQGESLEEAVRKQNKPAYGYLQSVKIPQYILRDNQQSLGSSRVTLNGFQ